MSEEPNPTKPLHARVLIVDDHPGMATTLARAVSQIGPELEVISANGGRDALDRVKDLPVDLLITDMMMPDMNGMELIEKLYSHPAGRPAFTILMTAYDVPGLKESARRLKVNETIIKPFPPERLRQIVRVALEGMNQTRAAQPVMVSHQQFKILVADDVSDNVSLLARYLQSEGFHYITASDGAETLDKTRSEMPDLILLDVNMPQKDGFEVIKELRADPAIEHTPVIILTAARIDQMDIRTGLNVGADDYITKPFDRRELLARIRTKLRAKESEDTIRRRSKEFNILPEIGREFSARTDLDELAGIILRRTVETLGAGLGHIFILDSESTLHKSHCVSALSPAFPEEQLPPLSAMLDQIKDARQGLIIPDVHADLFWRNLPGDSIGSILIVPLLGRLNLIGLLVLIHEKAGYFNTDHQLMLRAIASQAAIALENAQLYGNTAQAGRQTAVVLQDAADAVLIFNAESRLGFMNPAGKKLFADHPAKTGQSLLRGQGYDPLIDLLEECRLAAAPQTGQIVWSDGCPYTAQITPLKDGGCTALLYKAAQSVN
jgi:CheY-like chemotaxis protein